MDIGRAITFVFDDEEWITKLAIGAALLLASVIPLVNIFTALVIAGYSLRLLRQVANGNDLPLPNWDDWGDDWIRGAKLVVAAVVYALPALLLSGIGALIGFIGSEMGNDGAAVVGLCNVGVSCLSSLWGILVALFFPGAMINFATKGEELGAFFRFSEIWDMIRSNLGDYVVAVIIGVLAEVVASFGLILCVIGVFVTGFWSTLVQSHLYGQVAAQAAGATMAPPARPSATSYGELDEPSPDQDDLA